jgi:hypothetical protein
MLAARVERRLGSTLAASRRGVPVLDATVTDPVYAR